MRITKAYRDNVYARLEEKHHKRMQVMRDRAQKRRQRAAIRQIIYR